MTSSKVVIKSLQVPLSSIQCALLLSKNALLFPELPFYFQLMLLCFLEFPFCFPEVPFHFSKIPCCFLELSFVYQKCLIFIFYAHLFPRMIFFPVDDTFSLSHSELLREIIFALLLFCFLLQLFIDQLMMQHHACAHIQAINKLWLLDARTKVFLKKYKLYQNLFRYKKLETYI